MRQGFYDSRILNCVVLYLYNTSLGEYQIYSVCKTGARLLGAATRDSVIYKRATFLMSFNHYPSLEELQQYPELFI